MIRQRPNLLDITLKPESKPSSNPLEKDHAVGRIGIMPAIERPIVAVTSVSPFNTMGLKNLDENLRIDDKEISGCDLFSALGSIKPDRNWW